MCWEQVCTLLGSNKMVSNLNTISSPVQPRTFSCSAQCRGTASSTIKFTQIKFWRSNGSGENWTYKSHFQRIQACFPPLILHVLLPSRFYVLSVSFRFWVNIQMICLCVVGIGGWEDACRFKKKYQLILEKNTSQQNTLNIDYKCLTQKNWTFQAIIQFAVQSSHIWLCNCHMRQSFKILQNP